MSDIWKPRHGDLEAILREWETHIEKLKGVEYPHYQLEATEKPLFYRLFSLSHGKTVGEREAFAYTHTDWKAFQDGLSESRALVNAERRKLSLVEARYQAAYLEAKHNQKQGG